MSVKAKKPAWGAISYRPQRAHLFREGPKQHYLRSSCGIDVLSDHIRSAVGLERCKTCERVENQ